MNVEVENQQVTLKYSLRPRNNARKKFKFHDLGDEEDIIESDFNGCDKSERYFKRSVIKQRSQPLSKYRRKTANARERSRMKEINSAFESLRKIVPAHIQNVILSQGDASNEKLTKITTLKLAMIYIAGLEDLLREEKKRPELLKENFDLLANYHPTLVRNDDTCTLAALNTPIYDIIESPNSILNDGGSDGESLHSGATFDTEIEQPIGTFLTDLNLNFSDNLLDTEFS